MADAAASGYPSFAIVGGEAGVGKSRLIAEIAGRLRSQGWLVVEGGSVALGDDSLPFGPIVEALRDLAHAVDPKEIAAAAGPSLAELAHLVPELSGVIDDPSHKNDQAEWLHIRIFEGVLRLLGRLGETAPILLVIEDLHWSDRSTRDLLAFLARNARTERLVVMATTRTDELNRDHPMTAWFAEAERQPQVERIDLVRFERDELVELLTGIAGAPPTASLVKSVARRSEGNAFFAEELMAAFEKTGKDQERLPDTLRGVLLVRLSALSDSARRLVAIAAVAGRQVEHDVLAAVCGMSEPEMVAALHEAVDAQLLLVDVDDAVERYAFRHALVQEAAYAELLPSERRPLHAAYARAIEARPAAGGLAEASLLVERAYHWMAAHDPTRALIASIEAGDASKTVYADAEAVRQFERAIELWEVVPASDRPIDRDLADLYDSASDAARRVGDSSRAVILARREMELVDEVLGSVSDGERRARARERLSQAIWLAGDITRSIRLAEDAVALYEDVPKSSGKARVLSVMAANLMIAGRPADSVAFAERAIEAARAIRDEGSEARALTTLGVDLANLGNVAGGIDLLRKSLAIMSPVDDPTGVLRGYANLGALLEMGGLPEEALRMSIEGVQKIKLNAMDPVVAVLEINAAALLIELGRFPEAATWLERNVARLLPGISTFHFYATATQLALRTGDLATARRHLGVAGAAVRGAVDDPQFLIEYYSFGTEIALWDDDPAAALMVAREGIDRLVESGFAVLLGQFVISAAHAAADLAVRARAARDLAGAEAAVGAARNVIERYRASTARLTMPDALATREIGWRMALCAAELARANGADDPAHWDAVQPALAARPAPFLEAYVLWRKAEAVAGEGKPKAAGESLHRAHAIATAIGAALLVDRIEDLGRRLRIDLESRDVRVTPKVEPSAPTLSDPFGLSKREREVLPLVARGYTNRRIGRRYSFPKARREFTSRTSSASSGSRHARRPPRSLSGSGSIRHQPPNSGIRPISFLGRRR